MYNTKISYIKNDSFLDDCLPIYEFYNKNLILRIPFSNSHDENGHSLIAEYYIPLKELKEELEKV